MFFKSNFSVPIVDGAIIPSMSVSAIIVNPDICSHVGLSVFYSFLLIHISVLCLGCCFSCLFVQYNLNADVIYSGLLRTLWVFFCASI